MFNRHVRCTYRLISHGKCVSRNISVLRPSIDDETSARNFVNGLSCSERELIQHAIVEESGLGNGTGELNRKLLAWEALYAGVPFLGFGFLDNTIMLSAGEYIDISLGSTLGMSTLAAAAMGNLISDVAGIGTAGTVERRVKKILGRTSVLTARQRESAQAHRWTFAGRCFGIGIGCVLGMWPLLLVTDEDEEKDGKGEGSDCGTS